MMNVLRNAANAFFGVFWTAPAAQIEDAEQGLHLMGTDHAADDRTADDRTADDRPAGDRPAGDRPAGDRPAGDRPGDGSGLVPAVIPQHIHRLIVAHDFLNEIVVTMSEDDERSSRIQKTIDMLRTMHRSRPSALGSTTTPIARREPSGPSPVVRVRPHPFRWSDCTWRLRIFASVGLVCSALCPMFLSTYRFRVLFSLVGILMFGAVFGMRFIIRDVRLPPWWVGILNGFVGLIAFESGPYPSHLGAIYGFTLLTAAVFCMVSIIEPSTDYGLLLLSSLFPIQVAAAAFPFRERSILEAGMYLPVRMVAMVYRTSDSLYVVISPWYAATGLVTLISMAGLHCQRRRRQ